MVRVYVNESPQPTDSDDAFTPTERSAVDIEPVAPDVCTPPLADAGNSAGVVERRQRHSNPSTRGLSRRCVVGRDRTAVRLDTLRGARFQGFEAFIAVTSSVKGSCPSPGLRAW